MPPGPGSLTIIQSFMPSSGWTRMTSRLAGMASDGMSKMTCGTRLKATAISEKRCGSRLPVRR